MRKYLLPISIVAAFWSQGAFADLAAGTPHFSCTLPTQNTNGTTIPATGSTSLAAVKFYVDNTMVKHVIRPGLTAPATSTGTYTGTPTAALVCDWQTVANEIAAGSHNAQVTAINVANQESTRSNTVPFVVPVPTPAVPSGLSVD